MKPVCSKDVWPAVQTLFGLPDGCSDVTIRLRHDQPATVTLTQFVGSDGDTITERFVLLRADFVAGGLDEVEG